MPPPSTVKGIIGAAAGWKPEELGVSTANLRLGVELLTNIRTEIHALNHLKSLGELEVRTQVPVEIIKPRDAEALAYRITVVGEKVGTLQGALRSPAFPLSLGPAYCLASIHDIEAHPEVTIEPVRDGIVHGMIDSTKDAVVGIDEGGMSRMERMAYAVNARRMAEATGIFMVHDGPVRCHGNVAMSVEMNGHRTALF